MSIAPYTASELYDWLMNEAEILVLDVRNKVDFARFQVESPKPFKMLNVSYFDFMEIEEESVALVPKDRPIKVVCAKEGSAKYVAEILEKHGYGEIGYLEGGIKSWGNLLVPVLLNPGSAYELYQFIRPGKASCSYGLMSGDEMMLFDPSRSTAFYEDFASRKNCKIIRTFETHLQADYIAGSRIISQNTGAEFMANENDFAGSKISYTKLTDDSEYGFADGSVSVKAIFSPGHTPGSTCFLIDGKFLVTGDTIFIKSIGRPDLGGKVDAWSDLLFDTLKKIQTFPQDTIVLPAHYMDWSEANEQFAFTATLAETIAVNKEIYNLPNKESFLAFIKSNMRKQPDEYATIRLINANLEQVDDDKAEELDLGKNECAATAYAAQQQEQENA